jgi:hypothetical protein
LKRVFLISAVALAYLLARNWEQRDVVYPPGVLVPKAPVQSNVEASLFAVEDYQVTRRARFEIRARVLSSERYYLSRESDLSPIDLALGWGPMSDQSVLDQIQITQSARWYRTRYEHTAPVSNQLIIQNSSNMHMIPAQKGVGKALKELRKGQIVVLRGFLVDVDHESGWRWRTSLTRNDTGAGACEIVYVESVIVE